jgi:hypothetical protein
MNLLKSTGECIVSLLQTAVVLALHSIQSHGKPAAAIYFQ